MSELLPSRQAMGLRDRLLDYVTTTFALADADARAGLQSFLEEQADGMFRGPFVRTRLPFASAPDGWESALDVLPDGFVPYGHQAAAFARLSSRTGRPQPTLVTTGTGSGKTEAFLLPILDHVLRARREGRTGMSALVLYPMNALANDQAMRLARLITSQPRDGRVNPYAGVTAALYTGDNGPKRTKVTSEGLITERSVIRSGAPDIVLTNYKMLDHLLLRHEDAALWERSADSLRYVVLDEFHTYDGAQGTDVAMLLRRLGLVLKHYWPERGSQADRRSAADWERPLGQATPVGTSATLGEGGDSAEMVQFATEVFGEEFDPSCVVAETRLSWDDWVSDDPPPAFRQVGLSSAVIDDLADCIDEDTDGATLTRTVLEALLEPSDDDVVGPSDPAAWVNAASDEQLLQCARSLPIVQSLFEETRDAASLDELVGKVLPVETRGTSPHAAATFVSLLIAVVSHLRAVLGRQAASVEVHLWIRELTRIDRVASSAASYLWGDDGSVAGRGATDGLTEGAFPAIYCRHCGRSGWGVELGTTGSHLASSDAQIRTHHLARTGRFRALVHAPSEAQRARDGYPVDGLTWLNTQTRDLATQLPDPDDEAYRDGRVLPVLAVLGRDADDDSRDDVCPSCQQRDGIRFLGSAIATLLSVTLTTLFGSGSLDPGEKKALVFTDSVQDAAHRAGFVAARSHTFSLRAAIRDGFSGHSNELNLPELADAIVARAGDDPFRRYRLLPSIYIDDEAMRAFWDPDRRGAVPRDVRDRVRKRLLFDLGAEFGFGSQIGRTLEATNSVTATVNVGAPSRMAAMARRVLDGDETATLDGLVEWTGPEGDATLVRWVRGVAEHMRTGGAIEHPWLARYIRSDGSRWFLTGGRPREGMPSFPRGRQHPAFPRIGGKTVRDPLLDPVTDVQSWYARWTSRALGVSARHGASLAKRLLERLAKESLLNAVATDSGATVYAIPPTAVLTAPTLDIAGNQTRTVLECDTCHNPTPCSEEVFVQLSGAPCLHVRCPGHLAAVSIEPNNYYRSLYGSADMRRIVAREHTSLLDAKVRLDYENGFKQGKRDPDAPNTLVATPTLEMGIDIGDLSAVFLASLPRTVASYLQRVGRAGRLTGNALNIAYVTGRGASLPRLSEPTSLINGRVRPPAIYLSAEEILQRQYLAHLVDGFARDDVDAHHPRTASIALSATGPGSFLGDLIEVAEKEESLDTFLECFGTDLRQTSVEALRAWAHVSEGSRTSGVARQIFAASRRWLSQREALEHRRRTIETALPGLEQAAAVPAASDDDKRSVQTAQAALRLTRARLADITGEYWIAALEQFGLLPNYTLLGDSATLDIAISWYDPDTGSYEHVATGVQRPVSQALREFAPGATFYARGLEIAVDAVDLGTDADGIRDIAFCPECGYAVDTGESGRAVATGACPRCGSAGLQDVGQRLAVVELARASAAIRRDEARIDDGRDERQRARFSLMTAADIDPQFVQRRWYVDGSDFGASYLSRVTMRWLNVGKRSESAPTLQVAGEVQPSAGFRVCEACGHIDNSTRSNTMDEHRPWCPHRKSPDEHTRTIMLARTLTTQGVLISLPWNVSTGDMFALPSLKAALLLGLRETFGGTPDHIGVELVRQPQKDRPSTPALLLHDTVPGGTGYLADLAGPDNLWTLLRRAYLTVVECPCRLENRLSCHRCLLPYAPPHETDTVSRQSAVRHLGSILDVQADTPPPADREWQTSDAATVEESQESHLEVRFRGAFRTMAERLGAAVREEPGPLGNTMFLTLGHVVWSLTPQVDRANVRPDFMLEGPPGHPKVAIFTDGFAYHATPDKNRIADDAAKRHGLRLRGDRVLAITSRDLESFDAGRDEPPDWFHTEYLPGLTQMYGFSRGVADAALRGPLSMLGSWMQQASIQDHGKFASAVPAGIPRTLELNVPERAPLPDVADTLFDDPTAMSAQESANAWWWRQGALGVLARGRSGQDESGSTVMVIDVAVVLDDRPESVAAPGFRRDWETWLQVSNLVAFRTNDELTAITVLGQRIGPEQMTPAGPRRAHVEGAWAAVMEALLDDPAAGALAEALSRLGVAAPDVAGDEIGAQNIPVDLAWTSSRVAVLLEPDEADVHDLTQDGWSVISPVAETVAAALQEVSR